METRKRRRQQEEKDDQDSQPDTEEEDGDFQLKDDSEDEGSHCIQCEEITDLTCETCGKPLCDTCKEITHADWLGIGDPDSTYCKLCHYNNALREWKDSYDKGDVENLKFIEHLNYIKENINSIITSWISSDEKKIIKDID